MENYTLGFIGTGHIGAALAEAARRGGDVSMAVSNRTRQKAENLAERLGCVVDTASGTAGKSRFVVIGVRPQNITELFAEISPALKARTDRFIIVSVATGVMMERIEREAGFRVPVIRIMPNTPVAVGAGCILVAANALVTDAEREEFKRLFDAAGTFVDVAEELFDAGSALSGSGPAYVCRFIMSLASAGERIGFSPDTAMELAKATVFGTGKLVGESGETPKALCDAVCSPGGSTIEGIRVMEASDLDEITAATLKAAFKRNIELGKA